MESAYGSAGYRYKHHREYGVCLGICFVIIHLFPYFWNAVMVYEQHHAYAYGHKQQCEAENGVETTYEFVYRQECGGHVICKDYYYPEQAVQMIRGEAGQQVSRVIDKYGSYEYHEQQGEPSHHKFYFIAQLASDYFRKRGPAHAYGHHARQIIVNTAGEYCAQHYP